MSRSSMRRTFGAIALLAATAFPAKASDPAMERANGLYQANQFAPAAAIYAEIVAADPDNALAWYNLASALYRGERFAEALDAWLRVTNFPGLKPVGYYHAACAHALLGNPDEAFQFLFAAQDAGYLGLSSIRVDSDLASLRDDPRFEKLRDYPYETLALPGGGSLEYVLLLPDELGGAGSHPVLIALPPGEGNRSAVEFGLGSLWGTQATARGFIVVSPTSPAEGWNSAAGAAAFSKLLDVVAQRLPPEGGKFHLAGCSAGGDAAFHLALRSPERFHGILTAPGVPVGDDADRLAGLAGLYVELFVGDGDTERKEASRRTRAALGEAGIEATLHVLPGEHYVLGSLFAGALAETLEAHR